MGREIRRVPATWQHPVDARGEYRPFYDEAYRPACEEWLKDFDSWRNRTYTFDRENWVFADQTYAETPYYWDWSGPPPNRDCYRDQEWTAEDATAYQVYETVSEGTPVSPVFGTEDEMRAWLRAEGYSADAVESFVACSFAPSMIVFRD